MSGDRARGVAIYAGAALLLGAGGFWWVSAAPSEPVDQRFRQWTATAERLLPDITAQADADTVTLVAGTEQEMISEVGGGSFVISMVCVGEADSRVRVRVSQGRAGTDSGRGLSCYGDGNQDNFRVALADELRLVVSVSESSPVVFRYSVLRI